MKRLAATLMIALFIILGGIPSSGDDATSVFTYVYSLLTENPDAAIKDLRSFASDRKGYVSHFSNAKISVRIPRDEVESMKKRLANLGYISDERLTREDVSSVMLDLETRLKVQRKLLDDLTAIFSGAKMADTLRVEQEVGKVIVEIEDLKGRIGYYKNRISLCDMTVHINRSSEGSGMTHQMQTHWNWIRNLGIEKLVKD